MKTITKFKCSACGKLTAGRISRDGKQVGDTSARFPRRHKNKEGKACPGNILEAEWMEMRADEVL